MSNDPLKRLSQANPVREPIDSASTPVARAALREILSIDQREVVDDQTPPTRFTRRRLARVALPSVAIAAVIAVIVVISGLGGPGSSLVTQAYAATQPDGAILHYTLVTVTPSTGQFRDFKDSAQVWVSSGTWHAFVTSEEVFADGMPLRTHIEETLHHGGYEFWGKVHDAPGVIQRGHGTDSATLHNNEIRRRGGRFICPGGENIVTLLLSKGCETPLQMLRSLYRSPQAKTAGLTQFEGQRVDVLLVPQPAGLRYATVKVLIDPTSYAPLQLQITDDHVTSTTTFSDYTRLPLNSSTSKLLQMRPHPGARVIHEP